MSKPSVSSISLEFDLVDLPTAQHKAGLGGLLLQIQSMVDRKLAKDDIPKFELLSRTMVRIKFTQKSIQKLLDDLYAAKVVEIKVKAKWSNAAPKHEIQTEQIDRKTGKVKWIKQFVYDVVQPQAPCLMRHLPTPDNNPWLKLWRAMVWSVPRGIYKTRAPFNERSRGESCTLGATIWDQLVAFEGRRQTSQLKTEPISGALMLGAQSANAESVPFAGRIDHNLLLHFWQVVVLTYIPQAIDNTGQLVQQGYVLAIPEIADLKEFLTAFPKLLATLDVKERRSRPIAALIDVPIQANLEFLRILRALASGSAQREAWIYSVVAVESYHMTKLDRNVKLLSFERVVDRPDLVQAYARIRDTFRNPLFRAARLLALVRDEPWYAGMLALFSKRPLHFFIEHEKTPPFLSRFGTDARTQFKAIFEDNQGMNPKEVSDSDRLSLIIQRLINKYVQGRAETKTGKKVKDFPTKTIEGKKRRIYPSEFREAQQRICADAFLAMRSRHDQDFVEYFAGSICSVAQYLSSEDYQFLTSVLLRRTSQSPTETALPCWQDVKALAMIAVSACSYISQPREAQPQRTKS